MNHSGSGDVHRWSNIFESSAHVCSYVVPQLSCTTPLSVKHFQWNTKTNDETLSVNFDICICMYLYITCTLPHFDVPPMAGVQQLVDAFAKLPKRKQEGFNCFLFLIFFKVVTSFCDLCMSSGGVYCVGWQWIRCRLQGERGCDQEECGRHWSETWHRG